MPSASIEPDLIEGLKKKARAKIKVEAEPGEKKNGWDSEKLSNYLAEREAQKSAFALQNSGRRRIVAETTRNFDPFKW